MPEIHTTTPASDAECARARSIEERNAIERRREEFEPELTEAEIAAEGLTVHVHKGITFYIEPAICPACTAGHHEQPALHPCDCACHGHAPSKPAAIDYFALGVELATDRRAA